MCSFVGFWTVPKLRAGGPPVIKELDAGSGEWLHEDTGWWMMEDGWWMQGCWILDAECWMGMVDNPLGQSAGRSGGQSNGF
ncbi:MAG: hypothetical protein C5B50_16330 [Verrucomicrobia bacterium]|nr:MAG: hypothetical protein C5B50_16330 [Verrucomicrobiota bacterium]